jgi:hypothetical protein
VLCGCASAEGGEQMESGRKNPLFMFRNRCPLSILLCRRAKAGDIDRVEGSIAFYNANAMMICILIRKLFSHFQLQATVLVDVTR